MQFPAAGGMNRTSPRPTLETVAALAGTSRATASRVVNGSMSVNTDIRDAVERAVHTLGYVPNRVARSLVTQRMDTYALVLTESAGRIFAQDSFFATVVHAAARELDTAGKELVLQTVVSERSRARIIDFALSGHVDGVMVVSLDGADTLPQTLAAHGVPVVINGRPSSRTRVPFVDVANADGARAAVRHLTGSGRRHVATIAGPQEAPGAVDRLAGYRAQARAARLKPMVAVGDGTRESGSAAMCRLLADHPRIDAVFAANDLMAHGAMRALLMSGRKVPDDVAVIGFDDTEVARCSVPALTTVRLPIADIGRSMARQMLRLTAGEPVERAVVLGTELVIRESA